MNNETSEVYLTPQKTWEAKLRDRFAMAALTGLLSKGFSVSDELAREAYIIADIMLKERDKHE